MSSPSCPSCRLPDLRGEPLGDGDVVPCPNCGATYEVKSTASGWITLLISLPSAEDEGVGLVDVARPAAERPPPMPSGEEPLLVTEEEVEESDDLLELPQPRRRGGGSSSAVFSPGGLRPTADSAGEETDGGAPLPLAVDEDLGLGGFDELELPMPRRRSGPEDAGMLGLAESPRTAGVVEDALISDDLPALKIDVPDNSTDIEKPFDDLSFDADLPGISIGDPASSSMEFGEIDLGGGDLVSDGDLSDADPGSSASDAPEPEVDLRPAAQPATAPRPAAKKRRRERKSPEGAPVAKRGGRSAAVVVSSLLGVLIVAGLLMSLTSYGIFGWYYLEQYLEAAGTPEEITRIIDSAESQLGQDDYGTTRAAVHELGRERGHYSLAKRLLTRSVLHEALYQVRFGPEAASSARIQGILRRLTERGNEAPGMALANAADALRRENAEAAAGYVRQALSEAPQDAWVHITRGEVGLALGDAETAEEAFRQAMELAPTARAAWGVTRALAATNSDREALLASVSATLQQNAEHGEALILKGQFEVERGELEGARTIAEQVLGSSRRMSASSRAAAHVLLADLASRVGDWRQAGTQYEEALSIQGLHVGALMGAGDVFLQQRRWHEALERFRTVSENLEGIVGLSATGERPVDAQARLGASQALLQLDRKREALETMEALRQERPDDREVQLWMAKAQQAIGELQAADTAFRAIVRAHPSWPEGYLALSEVQHLAEESEAAAESLRAGRAALTGRSTLWARFGAAELEQGRPRAALADYERALRARDDDAPALFGLAVALRRAGELARAGGYLERLAAQSPGYPGLSVERGRLFEAQGQAERAVESYTAALEANPEDVDLRLRLGVAQTLTGALDEAEENLSAVLRQRSNIAEAAYFLGRVSMERGAPDVALTRFEQAVSLDPSVAEYHLYVAKASLSRAGTIDLARVMRAAEAAMERDPMLSDAYRVRADVRLRLGSVDDALEDAERAIELNEMNPAAHAALADAHDQQGRWQAAMQSLERAVELDSDAADWWYQLGHLRFDNRRKAQAIVALQRAVELVDAQSGPVSRRPSWYAEAHRLLGDCALGERRNADAILAYQSYLEAAPPGAVDRDEVTAKLLRLGVEPNPLL